MPPEQTEAISKLQNLGGKVAFKNGGYTVDMRQTPVEDANLAVLKDIGNLKSLDLQGTRVTDAGLEHLRSLTSLDYVRLEATLVTKEGAESLKKSLPDTDVAPLTLGHGLR